MGLASFPAEVFCQDDAKSAEVPENGISAESDDSELFNTDEGGGDYNEAINQKWELTLKEVKAGRLDEVRELVKALIQLRNEMNYQSLDEYSLFFIHWAKILNERGKTEAATFYGNQALELSPSSPVVAAATLPLFWSVKSKKGLFLSQAIEILSGLPYNVELALSLVVNSIYPLLWAATFALIGIFGAFFIGHLSPFLSAWGRLFPPTLRGFAAPLAAAFLLVIPFFLKPLTAIFIWGMASAFVITRRSALPLISGTVILAWGILCPLKERIDSWINDEGVKSMLHSLSGSFRNNDVERLRNLHDRFPNNPIISYSLGQLFIKEGDYKGAEKLFLAAEKGLGNQSWTVAERGVLAFLQENITEAAKLHEEAVSLGASSSGFWFNYSKVKFAQLEINEARELLQKSRRLNPTLVDILVHRERIHGSKAIAEIQLPSLTVLNKGMFSDEETLKRMNSLLGIVSPFSASSPTIVAGITLILFGLIKIFLGGIRSQALDNYATFRSPKGVEGVFRVLPGGGYGLKGNTALGFFILAFCILLSFPLIGWPDGAMNLFKWFPNLRTTYLILCVVIWILLSALSFSKGATDT